MSQKGESQKANIEHPTSNIELREKANRARDDSTNATTKVRGKLSFAEAHVLDHESLGVRKRGNAPQSKRWREIKTP
jgi:hypothetical protein